jgi:hypothetical protein
MRTFGFTISDNFRRSTLVAMLTAMLLSPSPSAAIELGPLKLPSLHMKRREKCATIGKLNWHTSYADAIREAKCARKMLVINFVPTNDSAAQKNFEKYLGDNEAFRKKLEGVVLARIAIDAKLTTGNATRRLVADDAFQHLGRRPGFVILDFQHTDQPYYGRVVTALPFESGKYYRWENSHLVVALELPAGTITQRTMVWAVRTHPEAPQSTSGNQSPALAAAAMKQSAYQAKIGVQGHHNWETRFHQVRAQTQAASANEVVAESWPNQDLIDSCIDCVKSWRHSSGHWSAVRKRHRLFGYDIRKGGNGIWYGTGIFAN